MLPHGFLMRSMIWRNNLQGVDGSSNFPIHRHLSLFSQKTLTVIRGMCRQTGAPYVRSQESCLHQRSEGMVIDPMNQGFFKALGAAGISDGLDFVLPHKMISRLLAPLPGMAPLANILEMVGGLVDAGTRAFVEFEQGGSVLREVVAPIENFIPMSPGHILAVLAGEAEKKFLPQLVGQGRV